MTKTERDTMHRLMMQGYITWRDARDYEVLALGLLERKGYVTVHGEGLSAYWTPSRPDRAFHAVPHS